MTQEKLQELHSGLETAYINETVASNLAYSVVDSLKQHNADLLVSLWNDLYTVISLQKEKGPRAPPVESCVL